MRRLPAHLLDLPEPHARALLDRRSALLDRLADLDPVLPPGAPRGGVAPDNMLTTRPSRRCRDAAHGAVGQPSCRPRQHDDDRYPGRYPSLAGTDTAVGECGVVQGPYQRPQVGVGRSLFEGARDGRVVERAASRRTLRPRSVIPV